MFIYAMYLKMRAVFPDTKIDLSDMVHYRVHYGYEMNKVFNLPRTEFRINRSLKKIIEFLLFKTILERKQGGSLVPYIRKYHWPWIYFKGFYQSEEYFAGVEKEVREAFVFDVRRVKQKEPLCDAGDYGRPGCRVHTCQERGLSSGEALEVVGVHLSTFLLPQCPVRVGEKNSPSPLLCIFGGFGLGTPVPAIGKCRIH